MTRPSRRELEREVDALGSELPDPSAALGSHLSDSDKADLRLLFRFRYKHRGETGAYLDNEQLARILVESRTRTEPGKVTLADLERAADSLGVLPGGGGA